MSVQTDMDQMIRAIAVDHTYSSNSKKDASASTQPQPSPVSSAAQSFNSPAEISTPGNISPLVVTPEAARQIDEEIFTLDDSFEMEDNAKDLDFVPQTETESESDSKSPYSPPEINCTSKGIVSSKITVLFILIVTVPGFLT
ncbi:hypothetical protein KUCAC02_008103, partial [Chaenocephalus aceratus]